MPHVYNTVVSQCCRGQQELLERLEGELASRKAAAALFLPLLLSCPQPTAGFRHSTFLDGAVSCPVVCTPLRAGHLIHLLRFPSRVACKRSSISAT